MNRVQLEIDLMNRWLKEYGTSPYPARMMFIRDFEDPEILEYLGLDLRSNPSTRQKVNAMTRRMVSWDGRYVNDEYVWDYLGLQPFGQEGSLKLFRCVVG